MRISKNGSPTLVLGLTLAALTGGCAATHSTLAAKANKGRKRRPISVNHGKVFESEGRTWLWGGKTPAQHFDISKAKSELDYRPRVGLDEGLKKTADWYKEKGYL